jgi:NDP-sugar pyrophosphorylase family protein
LKQYLETTFVLSNGDELKDFPLDKLLEFHKNHKEKPLATIALVKVENPSDYGVPVMEGDKIRQFLEKPKDPPSNFISSGLYVLEPEVFKHADWSKGFLMIEKDIFPKLAAAGKLAGYKVENGRWYDCGTFTRWEKAIREW